MGLALSASAVAWPSVGTAQTLPTAPPETVGMSAEGLGLVHDALQRLVNQARISGAVALVARDGKVVHLSSVGDRYREVGDPMETSDIFFVQSMTKAVVSTALMMLYEDGLFQLDDPLSEYVPELADKSVVSRSDGGPVRKPAAGPITFRHILTHTAGVDPDRELLTDEEEALLGQRDTLEKTIMTWAGLPLAFSPGDRWAYGSSTEYVGYLVERISGQSLDRFLKERIFEPLGMVDTGYNVPPEDTDRVAAVYQRSGADISLRLDYKPGDLPPTRYFGGLNGLFSTVTDYFRFAQMILNGGELDGTRLLRPETVSLMTSNHVGDLPVRGCVDAHGYGFGLGFAVVMDPALTRDSLSPGAFGWCGAWTTAFWVDPTERIVMILLTQLRVGGEDIRRTFPRLVMGAVTESYGPSAP